MMTDQNRLMLQELDQQLELGLNAKKDHQLIQAIQHFKRAEQALLKLALDAPYRKLKAQRFTQAQQIQKTIAELEVNTESRTAPQSTDTTPEPITEDEENKFHPCLANEYVSFADVAGLDEVKKEIRLRMVLPFLHRQTALQFGISNGGGLLLYGPPGTGKTLIAKATTGELDAPFFSIKASDIVAKWFGESEQNIKDLFAATQQHERAVLFIDEIDALIPARSKTNSSVMARVVPQFLTELDGFHKSRQSLLLIGAINEPQSLDTVLLRPGRIDALVYVGLPDREAREYLFKKLLQNKPLAEDIDFEHLSEVSEGLSGADINNLCNKAARNGFEASLNTTIQPICQQQMLELIEKAPRSVSGKQLQQYQQFKQTYGHSA